MKNYKGKSEQRTDGMHKRNKMPHSSTACKLNLTALNMPTVQNHQAGYILQSSIQIDCTWKKLALIIAQTYWKNSSEDNIGWANTVQAVLRPATRELSLSRRINIAGKRVWVTQCISVTVITLWSVTAYEWHHCITMKLLIQPETSSTLDV